MYVPQPLNKFPYRARVTIKFTDWVNIKIKPFDVFTRWRLQAFIGNDFPKPFILRLRDNVIPLRSRV